jgi:hypothetical protein
VQTNEVNENSDTELISPFLAGLKILNAAWRGHTGTEQVGAINAAALLLHMPRFPTSHGTVYIDPMNVLKWLLAEPFKINTNSKGTKSIGTMVDYRYRWDGDETDDLCLYEYLEIYRRVKRNKDLEIGPEEPCLELQTHLFDEDHPLYEGFRPAKLPILPNCQSCVWSKGAEQKTVQRQ